MDPDLSVTPSLSEIDSSLWRSKLQFQRDSVIGADLAVLVVEVDCETRIQVDICTMPRLELRTYAGSSESVAMLVYAVSMITFGLACIVLLASDVPSAVMIVCWASCPIAHA
jgi:hypothetical protein